MVISAEADPHCNGSLDPVHGDSLVEPSEALAVQDMPEGGEDTGVAGGGHQTFCLHPAADNVQWVGGVLAQEA